MAVAARCAQLATREHTWVWGAVWGHVHPQVGVCMWLWLPVAQRTHRLSRSSWVSLGVPRARRLCSKEVAAEKEARVRTEVPPPGRPGTWSQAWETVRVTEHLP